MKLKNPFLHIEGNSCVVRCCTSPYVPGDEGDGGQHESGMRFRLITLIRKFSRSCRRRKQNNNKIEDDDVHPKGSMPC